MLARPDRRLPDKIAMFAPMVKIISPLIISKVPFLRGDKITRRTARTTPELLHRALRSVPNINCVRLHQVRNQTNVSHRFFLL